MLNKRRLSETPLRCAPSRPQLRALASQRNLGKMWQFCGEVEYKCEKCGDHDVIPIEDFTNECVGGSERGMREENV